MSLPLKMLSRLRLSAALYWMPLTSVCVPTSKLIRTSSIPASIRLLALPAKLPISPSWFWLTFKVTFRSSANRLLAKPPPKTSLPVPRSRFTRSPASPPAKATASTPSFWSSFKLVPKWVPMPPASALTVRMSAWAKSRPATTRSWACTSVMLSELSLACSWSTPKALISEACAIILSACESLRLRVTKSLGAKLKLSLIALVLPKKLPSSLTFRVMSPSIAWIWSTPAALSSPAKLATWLSWLSAMLRVSSKGPLNALKLGMPAASKGWAPTPKSIFSAFEPVPTNATASILIFCKSANESASFLPAKARSTFKVTVSPSL